jgi:hypothetical protein
MVLFTAVQSQHQMILLILLVGSKKVEREGAGEGNKRISSVHFRSRKWNACFRVRSVRVTPELLRGVNGKRLKTGQLVRRDNFLIPQTIKCSF